MNGTQVPTPPGGIKEEDVESLLRDSVYLGIYSATGVVAILGNGVVLWVVGTVGRMRTFLHFLLANMALSDIMCAVTYFLGLVFCSDRFIQGVGTNAVCVGDKAIQLTSFQVSSVTMVVVACDRWLAVFSPLRHNHIGEDHEGDRWMAVKAAVLIWIVAVLLIVLTSPSLAYQKYFLIDDGSLIKCQLAKAFDVFGVAGSETGQRVLLVLANLAHFWIPFTLIVAVYGSIAVKIWRRRQLGDGFNNKDAAVMRKWKTIKMLIAAVIVFLGCWLPFFVFNLWAFVSDSKQKRPCTESWPYLIVVWMAFSSCCYNPLVYWVYNEAYRKGLWDLCHLIIAPFPRRESWKSFTGNIWGILGSAKNTNSHNSANA